MNTKDALVEAVERESNQLKDLRDIICKQDIVIKEYAELVRALKAQLQQQHST